MEQSAGSWAFLSRFDPCIVDIEVPEGAKNLTLNLEIDEAKEDMLNEIRALEVRSHSLKGVLGERAREAVDPSEKWSGIFCKERKVE